MAEPTQINLEKLKVSCNKCSLRELCIPQGMSEDEINHINKIVERKKPVQKNEKSQEDENFLAKITDKLKDSKF